jgi:hypothetical protein
VGRLISSEQAALHKELTEAWQDAIDNSKKTGEEPPEVKPLFEYDILKTGEITVDWQDDSFV